ncbi:DUF581 domain-containing protein [Cephalotus follicularis]|uniref:DUF581 domain-containing protein n=1 Tax=Cephalotus follicularis TaxID=3775 RepID=A0A1Q3D4G2_CEPFO|nr:DUF581 domain-containing protein [Cephalotus follicularis]
MLRNRSRAVTSKQPFMADHSSQSSPTENYKRTVPSFFDSPRFRALTNKGLSQTEAMISPSSILDTKTHTLFGNPFGYDINKTKSPKVSLETKRSWDKLESKGIGLALIDTVSANTVEGNSSSKPSNRIVLFGTKLRIQIPSLQSSSPSQNESPTSSDVGIKTRHPQLSAFSSSNYGTQTRDSPRVVTRCLSVREMELSEDYTCVISHGPNPKTTHIFDNCIVESYCSISDKPDSAPEGFLSFCHTCKKNLEQKNDIYIYRGETAFCSQECRYQEMLIDGVENSYIADAPSNWS